MNKTYKFVQYKNIKMKKIVTLMTILFACLTIILAGCSSNETETTTTPVIESDSTQETAQDSSVEESIDEDLLLEEDDIELGELI